MPSGAAARPLDLPDELAWPVRVDPAGVAGPTRGQARGAGWRRTSHGFYVPSEVEHTAEQRIVEAARVLPVYGAVTGWAALRWLGGRWFEGEDRCGPLPVTLALMDRSVRPQPGIATSEERLDPSQIQQQDGIRVTVPAYAVLFEIRHARSDLAGLVVADMAAYDDLCSRNELTILVAQSRGWIGIGRGRAVVGHMEENAWSPAEVAMRMLWILEAGLPRPMANRPVFDVDGRFLGTPDLIDPVAGVVGEYDSELHLEPSRRRRDRERERIFGAVGLETVAMVTGELAEPWPFLARLRAAYARAERRPASDRRWTLEHPRWWTPTETVGLRRALTAEQQGRWLRYRQTAA